MARMLNPVHLVLGEDDFLAERATKAIVAQAGEGVEVTTLRAGDVSEGEIAMATSPVTSAWPSTWPGWSST